MIGSATYASRAKKYILLSLLLIGRERERELGILGENMGKIKLDDCLLTTPGRFHSRLHFFQLLLHPALD